MKTFRFLLATTVASGALATGAFAQSTGSIDFDEPIVVTGSRASNGIEGIQIPDTTKAKGVLTQEMISHGASGNTILDAINLIPGVSFQNNDPFGSAGGTLNIRGFGPDRISLTFDGVPLNDTGNYAVYPNQQLDPELIDQVNVNLGSTDVDSPTAAASGGTVNYRTRDPYDKFGVTAVIAGGDYDFYRMFGSIDTGEFTPFGTKAFIAASRTGNRNVYNDLGKIEKQQYNARIYQPIGSNGDFVSVAGNYNENRNNFFGSLPLRVDMTQSPTNLAPRVVGPNSSNRFPTNSDERSYSAAGCTTSDVTVRAGVADPASTCGTVFDFRYNPSNTGNIRINSRFTLMDGLVLTVDPSYQYVKANGGGTATARESGYDWDATGGRANCTTVTSGAGVDCLVGYFAGNPYFGRDLNGDGDLLDQVTVVAPSQTQTDRYGVIASLRYDINSDNTIRIAYTLDYGHHRQTGEVGFLQGNGLAIDPFPVNNGATTNTGSILEKRDRTSLAILNQVAGEYRGKFLDEKLSVTLGLRAPFFKRDLTNNCFTSSSGGFVECFGNNTAVPANAAALAPTYSPPQRRIFKYDKLLPNVGVSYKFTPAVSIYANYSKGLQVPSTDALYNSFWFPITAADAQPAPETTDTFEGGARYITSKLQAAGTFWYTKYNNRLASAYDPELNTSVYRNLGRVDKWGIDGSVTYQPIKQLTLYGFGSYLKSKIKDDIQSGTNTFLPTAGKRESGAPVYQLGGRVQFDVENFEIGFQGKRTGKRYIYDTNLPVLGNASTAQQQVFGAAAPGYTLFDLDLRYTLAAFGLEKSWVQLNATNLFDKFYVGGFGGNLNQTVSSGNWSVPFVQIGAPRAVMVSLHMQM